MRNLGLTVLTLVMVLALAPVASAQPQGLYIAPKIGYSYFKSSIGSSGERIGGGESGSKSIVPFGLALGYDFKPAYDMPLRVEFEYAYRGKKEMVKGSENNYGVPGVITADVDWKGEYGAQSFFINGYFDIYNSSPVTPYIGAGLGLARVSAEYQVGVSNITPPIGDFKFNPSKTKTNFAWNIGAGAAWKITDNVALDLGYRYADFGKVSPDDYIDVNTGYGLFFYDVKTSAHEVMVGLRFTF